MTCNDFECIWLFTKSTWILLKECPKACVCNLPENIDSPSDNEVVKSICITGDYQPIPSYCSGYCEFDWIFLENQNIGYWSLATNLCNQNCKCDNISYPGLYANQRVRVDCVSSCEPSFYKNYFQYSTDLHNCIELEEKNYSNYLSYCLSGISALGDLDILNYPTNNKNYYFGYIIDNSKVVKSFPGRPINYSKDFTRTFYGMTQDMNAVSVGSFMMAGSFMNMLYPFVNHNYLTLDYRLANLFLMGLPILKYEYRTDRFVCNDLFELINTDYYCRIDNVYCPIDFDLLFLEADIDHNLNVKFDFNKFRLSNVRLGDYTIGIQHIENTKSAIMVDRNVYANIDLPHFIGYVDGGLQQDNSFDSNSNQPKIITRLSFMSQLRRLNLDTFGIFSEFLTYIEDSNLGPFIGNIGTRMFYSHGFENDIYQSGSMHLDFFFFEGKKTTHNFNKAQIALLPKRVRKLFFEIIGDHVHTKIIKTYEFCEYSSLSINANCYKLITKTLNKGVCNINIVALYDNQPFRCTRNNQSLISYFAIMKKNYLDGLIGYYLLGAYEIWLGTRNSGKTFYRLIERGPAFPFLFFSRKKLSSSDSSIQCNFYPDQNFDGHCSKDQYVYCDNSRLIFYGKTNECLMPSQFYETFTTRCNFEMTPDCEYFSYYDNGHPSGLMAGYVTIIITDVISETPFIANAILIFHAIDTKLIGCPAITSSYVTIREIPEPTCN